LAGWLPGLLAGPKFFAGCLPLDRSHRRRWRPGGRFVPRCRSMMGASRGSGLLRMLVDAEGTAHCKWKRRPESLTGRATAPLWLSVESVGPLIAIEGSQQVQDTLFKKLWRGFARLFRPTYASANVGHPSSFLGVGSESRVWGSVRWYPTSREKRARCPDFPARCTGQARVCAFH
jgi:hypothetical protein